MGWIEDTLCEPLLPYIPSTLHPNWLTLLNYGINMMAFGLAALFPESTWVQSLLILLMVSTMITDCLDGMHARKTKQTSLLGEILDHALDAANTPLLTGALLMGFHPTGHPLLQFLLAVLPNVTYHAQLVHQHHQKHFVHPTVSGVWAQFSLCVLFLIKLLTGFPSSYWLHAIILTAIAVDLLFYYRKFGAAEWSDHMMMIIFTTYLLIRVPPDSVWFHWYLIVLAFRCNGLYLVEHCLTRGKPCSTNNNQNTKHAPGDDRLLLAMIWLCALIPTWQTIWICMLAIDNTYIMLNLMYDFWPWNKQTTMFVMPDYDDNHDQRSDLDSVD